MKKDIKVEFLRAKNLEILQKTISEKGKYKILSEYANFYDMRIYFKVNDLGDIEKKCYNPIIILFAFSNDIIALSKYLFKYSYPSEKQILKKIDRASNMSIQDLREKLMKTLVGGNLNFSKIFAKELYLKSKKDFFEVLYNFSFMGNPRDIKILYVYSLEKIFNEIDYDENILFIVISYLTKMKDDFSKYLLEKNVSNSIEKLLDKYADELDKKIYLNICSEIFKKYKLKNCEKFIFNISEHFKEEFILNSDLKKVLVEQ